MPFSSVVGALVFGALLFVVVIVVTAVLMVILQAVLPATDAGAERLADAAADVDQGSRPDDAA